MPTCAQAQGRELPRIGLAMIQMWRYRGLALGMINHREGIDSCSNKQNMCGGSIIQSLV